MTEQNVVTRFHRVAAEHASAAAIRSADQTLTYRELDELSDRTARALISRGIGPGSRVGLYFEREPSVMVALLGALKSGAGVVPLLSSVPAARLRQIADDAELRFVVAPDEAPLLNGLGSRP